MSAFDLDKACDPRPTRSKEEINMPSALTRRRTLLGTSATALTAGLSALLLPSDASACHDYKSPVTGKTGCGAKKDDSRSGTSSNTSQQQSTPSTNTGKQSGSGEPKVNGKTVRVSNGSQLQSALANATAGSTIKLGNGRYSGNFRITNSGTKGNPILIESADRLRAELRSSLEIRGDHVIVSGLSFSGASVDLRAHNCRVTRCYFNGGGTAISVRGADNAEIDRNEITRWSAKGVDFDSDDGGRRGLRPRIYRNYFYDSKGKGDNAAIGLGQHSRHHKDRVNALVEYNLCVDIPNYKAIFCKSSENTIRYNTFINCQGLVNRHGYRNKYIGNWLENSIDLIVNDEGCLVEGNKLVNCKNGLRVMAGNITSSDMASHRGSDPRYPYADSCQIINNDTNRITVGMTYSGWQRTYPARNTVLRGNTGKVSLQTQNGTRVDSSGQGNAGSAAVKLRPNQVGPWS
jgi:hypothetical protein